MFIKVINFYQKFISPILGNNCRYYPSCSEYSKWVFENDNIPNATLKTITRIMRCNQLFRGGIDYPTIKFTPSNITYQKIPIRYFLVPTAKDGIYYLIKKID
ncbi:MAG: membrane protein insertion efficiency factor YidD [Epsilonproteobacteria bacterium]|nr:membrane protein insertion efficiency factor YidD [Campylobacterota bacterium]